MNDRETRNDRRFDSADRYWDHGETGRAFRLFLAGAKDGDTSCQHNLGYFYDMGVGVRQNKAKALYWYRRAYRKGNGGSAQCIGTLYRERGNLPAALRWFRRAVEMGHDGAHLESARVHLSKETSAERAIPHLEAVIASDKVCAADVEAAKKLLKQLAKRPRVGPGSRTKRR